MTREPVDLIQYLRRQKLFSERAFGPGLRTKGVIDHIRKELLEVEAAPTDLREWIDVITLALDGAWRAGYSPEQIANQLERTLSRNEQRKWPDWRTEPPDQAIEHLRGIQAMTRPWPDPTPEMLASPEFEAVWQCIKRWDINVPDAYVGYCGATGNHVRAILDALREPTA